MSGGSFDYLYTKDIEDVCKSEAHDKMVDFLRDNGFLELAEASQKVVDDFLAAKEEADKALTRLYDVWRAAEMWQSLDLGQDDFLAAAKAYKSED